MTENRISEFEDRVIGSYNINNREKIGQNSEQSIRDLWDNKQRSNICSTEDQEMKNRRKRYIFRVLKD